MNLTSNFSCLSKIDEELSNLSKLLDKNIGIIERKRLDQKLNQLLDMRSQISKKDEELVLK